MDRRYCAVGRTALTCHWKHSADLKEPTTQMAALKSSHTSALAGDVWRQTDECQALGEECFYSDSFQFVFVFLFFLKKRLAYNTLAAAEFLGTLRGGQNAITFKRNVFM